MSRGRRCVSRETLQQGVSRETSDTIYFSYFQRNPPFLTIELFTARFPFLLSVNHRGTPRAGRQCVPARQPGIVNTRKNVHACNRGGGTRMRNAHAPTLYTITKSRYAAPRRTNTPAACDAALQPFANPPPFNPTSIHRGTPLDCEDTSRRTP